MCLVSNETTLDGLFAAARSARVRPRGGGGGGGAAAGRGGRQRARHRQRQRHRQPTPRRQVHRHTLIYTDLHGRHVYLDLTFMAIFPF